MLYFSAGSIVLLVVSIAIVMLVYLHRQVTLRLEESTQSIARTLELAFDAQIDAVNLALIAASHELTEHAHSIDIPTYNRYLRSIASSLPNTKVMRATDSAGNTVFGTDDPDGTVNTADREYFKALKSDPQAGLMVLNPLIARIDKKWVWAFMRRVNGNDGEFAGVIYGQLDIPGILNMFRQVNLPTSGIVAIRDKDKGLIARYRYDGVNNISTGDKTLSKTFIDTLRDHPYEGTYVVSASDSIDGVARVYSYRVSRKYGYLVSDGVDVGSGYAEWREQAWAIGLLALVVTIAVAISVALLRRTWAIEESEFVRKAEFNEQLRLVAFFDPLTKLPNRRLLEDRLEQVFALCRRGGTHGGLLFIDLDNFKPLNDSKGHDAGDLLLMEVATRLNLAVRKIDTVARIGGDEFVVVLNELSANRQDAADLARRIAEKIRTSVAEPYVLNYSAGGDSTTPIIHRCTASIGGAVFDANDLPAAVMHAADVAMYKAKDAGRNTVRFSTES